jgi:hypothetical protein
MWPAQLKNRHARVEYTKEETNIFLSPELILTIKDFNSETGFKKNHSFEGREAN